MKRIIDGKTYNTDTSTIVAEWNYTDSDDYETEATLYVTRGGAFFAVHRWEVADGHEKTYAEAISRDELDRLVTHTNDLRIISPGVLAEPPEAEAEDQPGATISFRLPAALKARIDAAAAEAPLSTNAWLLRCAERCLAG